MLKRGTFSPYSSLSASSAQLSSRVDIYHLCRFYLEKEQIRPKPIAPRLIKSREGNIPHTMKSSPMDSLKLLEACSSAKTKWLYGSQSKVPHKGVWYSLTQCKLVLYPLAALTKEDKILFLFEIYQYSILKMRTQASFVFYSMLYKKTLSQR